MQCSSTKVQFFSQNNTPKIKPKSNSTGDKESCHVAK